MLNIMFILIKILSVKRSVVLSLNCHILYEGALLNSICIMSEFSVKADDLQNIRKSLVIQIFQTISSNT